MIKFFSICSTQCCIFSRICSSHVWHKQPSWSPNRGKLHQGNLPKWSTHRRGAIIAASKYSPNKDDPEKIFLLREKQRRRKKKAQRVQYYDVTHIHASSGKQLYYRNIEIPIRTFNSRVFMQRAWQSSEQGGNFFRLRNVRIELMIHSGTLLRTVSNRYFKRKKICFPLILHPDYIILMTNGLP